MSDRKKSRIQKKYVQLRSELWPDINHQDLWDRTEWDGFTTIPRTMPHIFRILNSLGGKGKPLAETYFTLWGRVFDESIIIIESPKLLAFESGFMNPRGEANWKERMKILKELGFINTKAGVSGDYHYVLLYNPHTVIKKLRNEGRISDQLWNSLFERAVAVGAADLIEVNAIGRKTREIARVTKIFASAPVADATAQ